VATLASVPGGVFDQAFATFQIEDHGENQAFYRIFSFPPPGSCTLYSGRGNLLAGDGLNAGDGALDAGALTLQGPAGSVGVDRFSNPVSYFKVLYLSISGSPPFGPMPLAPGNYTISSDGTGSPVGAFFAAARLPVAPTWSSPAALAAISRTQPLNFSWTAFDGAQVIAAGGNYDIARDASAVFVCAASPGAGSLSVPVEILSAIPPRRPTDFPNQGRIHLGLFPAPAPLAAKGLKFGAMLAPSFLTREVVFQ
jgi:hypothetical protein